MKKIKLILVVAFMLIILNPLNTNAMHIMEGYLPIQWSIIWSVLFIPFFIKGVRSLNLIINENPKKKLLLGLCGAFVFILSALKIPSITGSCSHPTGVGLGTIMFGPSVMIVLGTIVLLFQALLLAHGGITTLGANAFSMAIVGPLVTFLTFKIMKRIKVSNGVAVFISTTIGGLATYFTTSLQLALAFPDSTTGVIGAIVKFMGVFMLTQVPIAIGEGILTTVIYNMISEREGENINAIQL